MFVNIFRLGRVDYIRERQPLEIYNYDDNDELAEVAGEKMPDTDVSFEDLSL